MVDLKTPKSHFKVNCPLAPEVAATYSIYSESKICSYYGFHGTGRPGTIQDGTFHCPFVLGQKSFSKNKNELNFLNFFTLFSLLSHGCPGIFRDGTGCQNPVPACPVATYQNPVLSHVPSQVLTCCRPVLSRSKILSLSRCPFVPEQ